MQQQRSQPHWLEYSLEPGAAVAGWPTLVGRVGSCTADLTGYGQQNWTVEATAGTHSATTQIFQQKVTTIEIIHGHTIQKLYRIFVHPLQIQWWQQQNYISVLYID